MKQKNNNLNKPKKQKTNQNHEITIQNYYRKPMKLDFLLREELSDKT